MSLKEKWLLASSGVAELVPISTLLSYILGIRSSSTKVTGLNYFADAFYDETGIDLTASLNENYNAADDYYEGTTSLNTVASVGSDVHYGFGDGNFSYRTRIYPSALSGGGTRCRVTLQASPAFSCNIVKAYIQEASGPGVAAAAPFVQLLFSGNANVTIPAGGTAQSDILNFTIDPAKAYVISFHTLSYVALSNKTMSGGFDAYYASGDLASQESASGFTLYSTSFAVGFRSLAIEVRNNLDLITNAYTAGASPRKANILALYNAIDMSTLGTDWKLQISRNNGSTWIDVPLTAGGASGVAGYNYAYGEADFTGAAGTQIRGRMLTANNKNIRDASVAMSWV